MLWDFEQSRELGLLRGGGEVEAFWKPLFCDGDSTLVGLQRQTIVVWDLDSRHVKHAFRLPVSAACVWGDAAFLAVPSGSVAGAPQGPEALAPAPVKKNDKKKKKKKCADKPDAEGPLAATASSKGSCILSLRGGEPRAVAWLQDAVVDIFPKPSAAAGQEGAGCEAGLSAGLIFATEGRKFFNLTD